MSDFLRPQYSPGQNTGVGSLCLLQGIFPTKGSNPGLLHCRWILCQLSHQGSPRILEWVAHLLFQGIFPTQGSNLGLLHCRRILYLVAEPPGKPHASRPSLNRHMDLDSHQLPSPPCLTLTTGPGHSPQDKCFFGDWHKRKKVPAALLQVWQKRQREIKLPPCWQRSRGPWPSTPDTPSTPQLPRGRLSPDQTWAQIQPG